MDKASENQLVEALEKFKGFKIVEGLRGEYYAWRDGLYIWEDGSLNKKATDDKRNCRGWFKNLDDLRNIIEVVQDEAEGNLPI